MPATRPSTASASEFERPTAGLRRPVRTLLLRLAIVGAVLAVPALGGFALFVRSLQFEEREPAVQADGIVALTGGSKRIEDAIDLLSKGFARRLLISGVNERTGRDEIERLSPSRREVVQCCVDLGYQARDTVGNAAEIRGWARGHGFRSLIVVTSNYHLPRALTELDRALPEVRLVPYAVVPEAALSEGWRAGSIRARLLASEYAKFVAVWLRTRWPGQPRDSEPSPTPPAKA